MSTARVLGCAAWRVEREGALSQALSAAFACNGPALVDILVDASGYTDQLSALRGQYDGIAGLEDLMAFYTRLPNPDKQFAIMPGISYASFQQKNYLLVYHILHSFYALPEPVYRGE